MKLKGVVVSVNFVAGLTSNREVALAMKPIFIYPFILLAIACAVTRMEGSGRVFNASLDDTFRGIKAYCKSAGFTLHEIASKSVETEFKSPENLGFPIEMPHRSKMSFALKRLSDKQTLVVANIRIEHYESTQWTEFVPRLQESRDLEDRIFDQIKEHIR